MKYKYILFDLDGTLFDYDKAEFKALKNTFTELGFRFNISYLDQYRICNKQLWLDFEQGRVSQEKLKIKRFEQLRKVLELPFNASEFSRLYLKKLSECTDLLDGSAGLIEILEKDFHLYLVTNGLKEVQRPRITNSEIGHYFKDVIISEEVGYAKPATEIFDICFQRMQFPAKEKVVMVGDSLTSDIAGGINYGIDTCWFNPSGNPNTTDCKITYEIKSLRDILPIVYNR